MKIILAEDDRDVRYAIALFLRKRGFTVVEAVNGDDPVISEEIKDTDVLVTDILMPDSDGIELLIKTRESYPDLPVIAYSGGGRISSHDYLETAATLGASATFRKPFDENMLAEAIEAAAASC
ncbi:MAG: response regulator [Rhodospirillaceae bacterium]|nr:response regulator [Rhodospirillaceae bacterium]